MIPTNHQENASNNANLLERSCNVNIIKALLWQESFFMMVEFVQPKFQSCGNGLLFVAKGRRLAPIGSYRSWVSPIGQITEGVLNTDAITIGILILFFLLKVT
jgi:hypothetical protein